MALRKLEIQILKVENAIITAQLSGKTEDVGRIRFEFNKLKFLLDGLTSFVEHRWQVRVFGSGWFGNFFDIQAEHLEEAREKAIALVDDIAGVVRYELYCDGILIPEEED